MQRDLTPEEGGNHGPLPYGVYRVEVIHAEEAVSSKGQNMMKIKLAAIDHDYRVLCWHNLILTGKGRGMGNKQLELLGVDPKQENIQPTDVVGRRAFVATCAREYEGKTYTNVDIRAEGSEIGFWSEAAPPAAGRLAQPIDKDIPF